MNNKEGDNNSIDSAMNTCSAHIDNRPEMGYDEGDNQANGQWNIQQQQSFTRIFPDDVEWRANRRLVACRMRRKKIDRTDDTTFHEHSITLRNWL